MKRPKLKISVIAALCVLAALIAVPVFAAATGDAEGLTIGGSVEDSTGQAYSEDSYYAAKDLAQIPVTLEAWLYIPGNVADENVGTLFGNFWSDTKYGIACLNYEILAGGIPRIYWRDPISSIYDIRFEDSPIPTDEWVHLAVVYDGDSGTASCYINGAISEEKKYYPHIDGDVLLMPMVLGGDNRPMNTNCFKGGIGDLTVYSDVRSSAEIEADFALGVAMSSETADLSDAICYYDIDENDKGKDIADESANGYELLYSKTWLTEEEMADIRESYGFTPAYSFAIMGDIQTTTDYYPEKLPGLYQWVVDHAGADDKNILFSISLGDLTNDNGRDNRYSKDERGVYYKDNTNGTYTQWDITYDAVTLLDGKVPYALIRGNHDVYPDANGVRLEGFNTYFERSEFFTSQFEDGKGGRYGVQDSQTGTYDYTDPVTGYKSSYANTYQTLTVGNNEYLFVNLDWILSQSIIDWAKGVIEAHPDHRVILSTHAYLNMDGTTTDAGDATPRSNFNGDVLREQIVSKYANIELVLSGHIGHERLVVNQVKGDHGNTVTEMLINPQAYDSALGGCAMVTMFYFDQSGDKLAVEWYSTSKDRYYKNINQFTIDLGADAAAPAETAWDGVTATKPVGSGTEASPYLISSAENLNWISKSITEGAVSFAGVHFRQTCDIDLGGHAMCSIGSYYISTRDMAAFGGIYDGCGFSIKNGTFTTADPIRSFNKNEGYGLFGAIYGATVKNVVLDDVQIVGRGVTGGIVGIAAAPTVTDTAFAGFNSIIACECKSTVSIVTLLTDGDYTSPSSYDSELNAGRVGSACGMAYSTLIKGFSSSADIKLSPEFGLAGGIVGTAGLNTSIELCSFSGNISLADASALPAYIGGILGAASPTDATVDFSGKSVGFAGGLTVFDCYNDGVFSYEGEAAQAGVFFGGIAGYFGSLTDIDDAAVAYPYVIENCYNLFDVSESTSDITAYGIVAAAAPGEKTLCIKNCFSADTKADKYVCSDGNTSVDGAPAIYAENVGTLGTEQLSSYTATIDSEIVSVRAADHARLWTTGSGSPTAAGTEGLKYFDIIGSVYHLYTDGAWVAVRNINITESGLATEYGTIDSDHATSSMVVFLYDAATDTYSCIGGSSSIYDVLEIARKKTQGNSTAVKVVIYFRTDVSFDVNYTNLSYSSGTIVFDLGGNTLYQATKNVGLFSGHAKAPEYCHRNTVIVENGSIVLNTAGLFHQISIAGGKAGAAQYESNTTDTSYKVSDFIFKGVNISLAEGATATSLIGTYADNNVVTTRNAKMGLNVSFDENCTIDITNAPSGFVLFDACDTTVSGKIGSYYATNSIVNIDVGACRIEASDADFTWHKAADNGSSVIYTKSENGALAEITVPKTVSLDTSATFVGEYGYIYGLSSKGEDTASGTVTYTLGTLDTPYGNVPTDYKNYTFLIYLANSDGTYTLKAGCDSFAEALSQAGSLTKSVANQKCVVYMTKDCESTATNSGNCGFNIGKIIIDLGGNTITQAASEPLIRAHAKYDNAVVLNNPNGYYLPGYYEIINGYIVLNTHSLFYVGSEGSGYNNHTGPYPKTVNWTLDGVHISVLESTEAETSSSTLTDILCSFRRCTSLSAEKDIIFNLTVKDSCSIDIRNAKNEVTLFNANDKSASDNLNAIVNITVEGCEIIASGEKFNWSDVNAENGSSVTFTDEDKVTVTLPQGSYTYGQLYTPYGNISPTYVNSKFVIFQYTGTAYKFITGHDSLANALSASSTGARNYCAREGTLAVVYMRGDYTSSSGVSANFGYICGTMVIDLGGHKLTQAASEPIFRSYAKYDSSSGKGDATYKLINGDIVLKSHGIFFVGMEGATAYATADYDKTLYWTLDDIDISVAAGATLKSIFTEFKDGSGPTAPRNMYFNMTVSESCTIDMTNAPSNCVLFYAKDSKTEGVVSGQSYYATNSIVNMTVYGCRVTAGANSFVLLEEYSSNINSSTVRFAKTDGGNYMQLLVPKSASGIDASLSLKAKDGTVLSLVKIEDDGSKVTYRLRPASVSNIDFTPKMSVTLDRDLVMNVYVPAELLLKFTLDGVEYADLNEIAEKAITVDAKDYYLISIPLAASEAARTVKLIATVSLGEKTATGTFTFSIPKYAERIIAGDDEIESRLVKDVLSYIRAAYAYFRRTDDDAMAKINAMLGDGYDGENAPLMNGSSVAPSTGLTSLVIALNSTPSIRFYVSGDVELYRFFADGVELDTASGTDSSGTYIEMDVCAYTMSKTITYTIDGTESGSFHINAYYTFISNDKVHKSNAELIDLVARFAKYCESAAEYRDAVLARS